MIYFVQQGKTGAIKIGYTSKDDVSQRITILQTASVEPLNLLGIMDGNEKQEKQLHQFFHAYKIRGEWFAPHPQILMYIMGLILGKPANELFEHLNTIKNNSTETKIKNIGINEYLKQQEITIIKQSLVLTHGNITEAAKHLGTSFRKLRHKITKYKIEKNGNDVNTTTYCGAKLE